MTRMTNVKGFSPEIEIDDVGQIQTMADQVVELGRHYRARDNSGNPAVDFGSILRASGRLVALSDVVALVSAFIAAGIVAWAVHGLFIGTDFGPVLTLETAQQLAIFLGMGALSLLWLDTKGHYRQRLPFWEKCGHVVAVTLVGFLICGFIEFASKSLFSRVWLAASWGLFGTFVLLGRYMARRILDVRGRWQIPAVIIGHGPSAQAARDALASEPEMGFRIVKQIDASALDNLKRPHSWKRMLAFSGGCHVFLAMESAELDAHKSAVQALVRDRVPCSIVPPWLGLPSSTLSVHHFLMHDVLLLHDTNRLQLPLPCIMKRSFDIVASGLMLLALLPVFLIVAQLVRRDGGPAFFIQKRVGRHGELFGCFKFRSMRIDAEDYLQHYLAANPEAATEWAQYQKLKTDVRITKIGNLIRRTSIDELPQLINVFLGHMSLVGPRPIMQGQEAFYDEDFAYYESVRPGITGPWQVGGRNKLTFKQRVALEACYARNWNFWMDVVILLKTIPAVLKKDNAF